MEKAIQEARSHNLVTFLKRFVPRKERKKIQYGFILKGSREIVLRKAFLPSARFPLRQCNIKTFLA
jgi:hypothetical protein